MSFDNGQHDAQRSHSHAGPQGFDPPSEDARYTSRPSRFSSSLSEFIGPLRNTSWNWNSACSVNTSIPPERRGSLEEPPHTFMPQDQSTPSRPSLGRRLANLVQDSVFTDAGASEFSSPYGICTDMPPYRPPLVEIETGFGARQSARSSSEDSQRSDNTPVPHAHVGAPRDRSPERSDSKVSPPLPVPHGSAFHPSNPFSAPPVQPTQSRPFPARPVQQYVPHTAIPQHRPTSLAPMVSRLDTQLSSLKTVIKEVHSTLKGIDKLKDGNYSYWSEQVYSAFEVRDLGHFLTGELVWPDPGDLVAMETCRKCDQLVSEAIVRTLDSTQFGYVNGQATTAKKWRILQEVHAPINMARALQVRQTLEQTILREGGSMSEHLNTLRDLVSQLRRLGQDMPEEAQKLIYLRSLPASYSHIRDTYLINHASLSEIVEGLRSVAQTRNFERSAGGSLGERAFVSQAGTGGTVCWDCCEPGHSAGFSCQNYQRRVKMFGTNHTESLFNRYKWLEGSQPASARDASSGGGSSGRGRGGGNQRGRGRHRQNQANVAETVNPTVPSTTATTPVTPVTPSNPTTEGVQQVQAHFASAADWNSPCAPMPHDLALSADQQTMPVSSSSDASEYFYIDSGCTSHMTSIRGIFTTFEPLGTPICVSGIGQTSVLAIAVGDAIVPTVAPEGLVWTRLRGCLYAPTLSKSLMSYSRFLEEGMTVDLRVDGRASRVVDRHGQLVASSFHQGGIWPVEIASNVMSAFSATASNRLSDAQLWHRRLGHLGGDNLMRLASRGLVAGLPGSLARVAECGDCVLGKGARLPFGESVSHSPEPLGLVHSDLAGPFPTSVGGAQYWITFLDDHSRYVWVRSLRSKSDAFSAFRDWHKTVATQTGRTLRSLRSDNGGEYVSDEWSQYLADHGISHQTSAPYTPQQNGRAERVNRTLKERVRCMLLDAKMAPGWWAELVQTAAYIMNRSPHSALLDTVPFETWTGVRPSVDHMRIPGAKCFAIVTSDKKAFDPRAIECRFLGYDQQAKAYRLQKRGTTSVIRSRDVIFHEHSSCADSCPETVGYPTSVDFGEEIPEATVPVTHVEDGNDEDLGSLPPIDLDWEEKTSRLPPEVESILPRRSQRNRVPSRKAREMAGVAAETTESPMAPTTYRRMMLDPHRVKWEAATVEEFNSWKKKGVYEVIELPRGHRRLGTKPVYVLKTNAAGEIERWKVRYVVLGNLQRPGEEFNETSSPTARPESLRLMCSLAACNDWELHQMDVSTAFLHGDIDCDIHLSIPDGFPETELPAGVPREELALRLHKAVYGLRQAGHLWFMHCKEKFLDLGFKQSETDPCLFYMDKNEVRSWVLVYVDDFTILARSAKAMDVVKTLLCSAFDLKDLGEAKQILGLEIERDRSNGVLRLFQRKYVRNLLVELGMQNCLPVYSPMEHGLQLKNHGSGMEADKLTDKESAYMSDKHYARILGSLNWIAGGSRPDVSFALSFLAQHAKTPGPAHWKALMRVVAYLRTTIDSGLSYSRGSSTTLLGYSDSDHAGDTRDYVSYTGYVFVLGGGAIAWKARKQQSVSRSSAEAEYMALSETAAGAVWLRRLVDDFNIDPGCTTIRMDSQSAMKMALRESLSARTKHIAVNFHFARNLIRDGTLLLEWVPGAENIADLCTKALPREVFRNLLGLLDFSVSFSKTAVLA